MTIEKRPWGEVGGEPPSTITISNKPGDSFILSDTGARLVQTHMPPPASAIADVIPGLDSVGDDYATKTCLGATVGRFRATPRSRCWDAGEDDNDALEFRFFG